MNELENLQQFGSLVLNDWYDWHFLRKQPERSGAGMLWNVIDELRFIPTHHNEFYEDWAAIEEPHLNESVGR